MLQISRNPDAPLDLLEVGHLTSDDLDPATVIELISANDRAFISSNPDTNVRILGRSGLEGDGIGFDELLLEVERIEPGQVVSFSLSLDDLSDGFLDFAILPAPEVVGEALIEHAFTRIVEAANLALADVHRLVNGVSTR